MITPDKWKDFDSKTPLFCDNELQLFNRKLAIAVQLNWYRSNEYKKLRDFDCGDTLNLRMIELEKAFGFDNGIPNEILEILR